MTGRENKYQEALKQGHTAAWDQDWARASEYYKQALDEEPEDPKALSNLALALFEMREYKQSLKCYLQLSELTPKDPVPLEKSAIIYELLNNPDVGSKVAVRAAESYLNTGDVDKAIENWVRATAMRPENLTAHSRLALVFERMRRIPQAVRAYLQIASIMQNAGQIDKAVQVINRALKISPQNEDAARALSTIREGKMLPKPVQLTKDTGPIKADSPPLLHEPEKTTVLNQTPIEEAEQLALSDLAELFFEQSSEEEAPKAEKRGGLKQIIEGTGPLFSKDVDKIKLRLHLGQVVDFLSRGEKERAADDLKRLIDIGLQHPAVYYSLGLVSQESERMESAVRYLRHSVNHRDYALASRLIIANILKQKGDFNKAAIEYLEALRIADSELVDEKQKDAIRQLYDPLIEAQKQESNKQESEKLCKSVSEILDSPEWRSKLQKIRGELFAEDDKPTPIAEVLTAVSSSKVVMAMSSIRKLAREGRRHAAFEEALFALQDVPTYLPLHITIGDILLAGKQTDAAIEKFKVVARSYNVRGEAGRAVDMLRRVVELAPLDLEARQSLIDQLVFRGKNEQVVEEYIKMAEVYYSLAELADARKTYTKGLRFIEHNKLGNEWRISLLHRIADIDVQSLNWRQGLSIYEKICAIAPDDFAANRNRIDLNFRLGDKKQAQAAIEEFVRVLKNKNRDEDVLNFMERLSRDWPQEAMIKSIFAECYLEMGRTKEAIDHYDDARAILFDRGDSEGAVFMLKKIIALNPEDVDDYKQLLENIQSNG